MIGTSTLHMTRAIVITFLFTGLPWLGAGVPKPGGGGGWGIYPVADLGGGWRDASPPPA